MRTVNTYILKEWLAKNGRHAHAQLSIDAAVSTHLIDKVLIGKAPAYKSRIRISQVVGIPEHELFPEIEEPSPKPEKKPTRKRAVGQN